MTERVVSSRLLVCPEGCRGPRPTSREFPINSLIKVDRLVALARKRARMWNMIKRPVDRVEMDVSADYSELPATLLIFKDSTFGPKDRGKLLSYLPHCTTFSGGGGVEGGGEWRGPSRRRGNPLTLSKLWLWVKNRRRWMVAAPQLICSSICLLTCERMSWLNRSVFVTRERLRSGQCFCTGRNSVVNVVTRFAALGATVGSHQNYRNERERRAGPKIRADVWQRP